ncbi:MAG: ParA family protein [Flavipsychrobacter sp.]
MSKVICLISPKGGAGKTTLTASFAALISSLGKKVLVIDLDASTNGLTFLYLKEIIASKTEVALKQKLPIGVHETAIEQTADIITLSNGVDLIPTSFSFTNSEKISQKHNSHLLENLPYYKTQYDYILLDVQTGVNSLVEQTINVEISDEIIIICEYDPLSVSGIEKLKALFPNELTSERTWILLNKILPEFAKNFNDFLGSANYLYPIPWDADVMRAYTRQQLALNLGTETEFTFAVAQNLKTLLSGDFLEAIAISPLDKEQSKKRSFESEFIFFKNKLNSLLQIQTEIQRNAYFKKTIDKSFIFSVLLISAVVGITVFQNKSHHFYIISSISVPVFVFSIILFLKLKTLNKRLYYCKMVDSQRLKQEIKLLEEKLEKLNTLCCAESKIQSTKNKKVFCN